MTLFCNAFWNGEHVQIADVATLERLQTQFADRTFIVPNMAKYAGRRVQIRFADSTDGYQFFEIAGRWMEGAIVDPYLQPDAQSLDQIGYLPASKTYVATADSDQQPGFVSVYDRAGRLFLKARSSHPTCDAESLNRMATIRCRLCFEMNLGFYPLYATL